jgi:hypothetical protein
MSDQTIPQTDKPKKPQKKVDVFNRGERSYTSPSGVHVAGGVSTPLDEDEAKSLMAAYPNDLISPDSLRSSPSSQSDKDRRAEIERLQGVVSDLEAKLKVSIEEGVGLKAKTSQHPLKGAFGLLGELLTDKAHKVTLEADEGLKSAVTMFHNFLTEHFKKASPDGTGTAPKSPPST